MEKDHRLTTRWSRPARRRCAVSPARLLITLVRDEADPLGAPAYCRIQQPLGAFALD